MGAPVKTKSEKNEVLKSLSYSNFRLFMQIILLYAKRKNHFGMACADAYMRLNDKVKQINREKEKFQLDYCISEGQGAQKEVLYNAHGSPKMTPENTAKFIDDWGKQENERMIEITRQHISPDGPLSPAYSSLWEDLGGIEFKLLNGVIFKDSYLKEEKNAPAK